MGREPDKIYSILPARGETHEMGVSRPVERSPSGLWRRLGKAVCGQLHRGFKSLSLRQIKYPSKPGVFYLILPAGVTLHSNSLVCRLSVEYLEPEDLHSGPLAHSP